MVVRSAGRSPAQSRRALFTNAIADLQTTDAGFSSSLTSVQTDLGVLNTASTRP